MSLAAVAKTKKHPRHSSSDLASLARGSSGEDAVAKESSGSEAEVSDEEVEAAQKRLKAAQSYLASLRTSKLSSADGEIDAEEMDRENVASRLQKDTLISRGRAFEALAERYTQQALLATMSCCKVNTPDGRAPTACCISEDGRFVFLATKSRFVYHYETVKPTPEANHQSNSALRRIHTFKHPEGFDSILCLALSSCGGYLVAGSHSGRIAVWNIADRKGTGDAVAFHYRLAGVLTQHRGAVLGVVFRRGALAFYSASADRTVKLWSIEGASPSYVETLFGHQDTVNGIAALARETCVTIGTRDRTARFWKLSDETQLLFRPLESAGGSQECVALIVDDNFVTGSDEGRLSLFGTRKKKPMETAIAAVGGLNSTVSALAAVPYTDLVAAACSESQGVGLWRASPKERSLEQVACLPVEGIVAGLAWSDSGLALAVASGKEPRLGRWISSKGAKNQLLLYTFQKTAATD
jgi:ribosomal RNA-processing protein 9